MDDTQTTNAISAESSRESGLLRKYELEIVTLRHGLYGVDGKNGVSGRVKELEGKLVALTEKVTSMEADLTKWKGALMVVAPLAAAAGSYFPKIVAFFAP